MLASQKKTKYFKRTQGFEIYAVCIKYLLNTIEGKTVLMFCTKVES